MLFSILGMEETDVPRSKMACPKTECVSALEPIKIFKFFDSHYYVEPTKPYYIPSETF